MNSFGEVVDTTDALLRNEVFSDDAVYRREIERVFGRSWLFLGHETMVANPGDYFTTFMGEDAVIVCRDGSARIRAYLNKCRHRGNKVCMYDRGNASSFACSFHGWTYDLQGRLRGVPHLQEAYYGDLDLGALGLIEVPKVATYGGLVFGCWNADVVPLDEYLGDMRWYLDNFLTVEYAGGLEIVPGMHRYLMPVNWKLLAENFAGDAYHFLVTHSSVIKLLTKGKEAAKIDSGPGAELTKDKLFSVACNYRTGPPHGLFELHMGPVAFERDLAQAERISKASAEWLKEKYRRMQERLPGRGEKPYSFHVGNIFPSFSLIGVGSQLYGRGLIVWHPRGPDKTEVWQWCAVDKEAPIELKRRMVYVLMHRQAATGLVAPDDHENFARITENLATPQSRASRLHYRMGLGHDGQVPHLDDFRAAQCPGFPAPNFSEINQREFYRYWGELMQEGQDGPR
jgi:phenylpropionate dioxygenase-like ring-hydroxylating dioxygenase large terminal subunit